MVTDGGSSKRVGIWINWGVGGGAGELHNIAHLFRSRKRTKGKMPRIQEWEPGMQCMGGKRSGPLLPISPTYHSNVER